MHPPPIAILRVRAKPPVEGQLGRGVVEVVDEIGGEEKMVPIDPPKE